MYGRHKTHRFHHGHIPRVGGLVMAAIVAVQVGFALANVALLLGDRMLAGTLLPVVGQRLVFLLELPAGTYFGGGHWWISVGRGDCHCQYLADATPVNCVVLVSDSAADIPGRQDSFFQYTENWRAACRQVWPMRCIFTN